MSLILTSAFAICTLVCVCAAVAMFGSGDTGGGFFFVFFGMFFGALVLASVAGRLAGKGGFFGKFHRAVCSKERPRPAFVPHWITMLLLCIAAAGALIAVIVPVMSRLHK